MSYYGWDHMVVMPIITTTVGVFLMIGTCAVVYLLWKEEERKQKALVEWREKNDSH